MSKEEKPTLPVLPRIPPNCFVGCRRKNPECDEVNCSEVRGKKFDPDQKQVFPWDEFRPEEIPS